MSSLKHPHKKKHKKPIDENCISATVRFDMNNKYYVRPRIEGLNTCDSPEKAKEMAERVSIQNPGQVIEILQVVGETITPHASPVTTMFGEAARRKQFDGIMDSLGIKPGLGDWIADRQKLVKRIEGCIELAHSQKKRIARFELDGKQFATLNCQSGPHSLSGIYEGYPVVMAMKFDCITEPKQP